jgi:hypothetical protein
MRQKMNGLILLKEDIGTGFRFGLPVLWKPVLEILATFVDPALIVPGREMLNLRNDEPGPLLCDGVAGRRIEEKEPELKNSFHPSLPISGPKREK